MKTCPKLDEPATLVAYRAAVPDSTWDQMKDDPFHSGMAAYRDTKTTLVRGQRCLCGFCEQRIADGTTDDEIAARRSEQRVEHFHPKADRQRPPNWALHWPNLWAVCTGGDDWPPAGEPLDPDRHIHPLIENLSCDAYKGRQIEKNLLPNPPEGWILAPDQVPPFPLIFEFASDGTPLPHATNCQNVNIPGNQYADTATLVAETIKHLNLGCTRLKRMRSIVRAQLEKQIEMQRKMNPGRSANEVMLDLARRLFSQSPNSPWPAFFTLIRWRLRHSAEIRLQDMGYTG